MDIDAAAEDGSLSLYFDLKPGEKADLEVVAAAAIKWVEALREAATAIDPDAIIRVDLVDASEGSLRLNTILEWAENQVARIQDGSGKYPRLRKLAIASAIFITFTGVPTYDFYFGEETANLSQEDRERLDELIELVREKPSVQQQSQEFFKELERDPSIKGIGVTEDQDQRPKNIIPSTEFPERSGLWALPSVSVSYEEERTIYPVVKVTLIAPVLVRKKRSWRFQAGDGMPEFSAKMADEEFLAALEEKHVRESLRIGIEMELKLKVVEVNEGGVWRPKSRTVIKVLSPKAD